MSAGLLADERWERHRYIAARRDYIDQKRAGMPSKWLRLYFYDALYSRAKWTALREALDFQYRREQAA